MSPADPDHGAWCSHIRDDFTHRIALRDGPSVARRIATSDGPPVGPLWMVNVVLVTAIPLVAASACVAPVFLILIAALVAAHLLRPSRIRARRLTKLRCPACEYDLHDLPEALPAAAAGYLIGPRRCPECGEPWPRVPDPA